MWLNAQLALCTQPTCVKRGEIGIRWQTLQATIFRGVGWDSIDSTEDTPGTHLALSAQCHPFWIVLKLAVLYYCFCYCCYMIIEDIAHGVLHSFKAKIHRSLLPRSIQSKTSNGRNIRRREGEARLARMWEMQLRVLSTWLHPGERINGLNQRPHRKGRF